MDDIMVTKIFIVGMSRSGTTMLSRMLKDNGDVLRFGELRFFEDHYSGSENEEMIKSSDLYRFLKRFYLNLPKMLKMSPEKIELSIKEIIKGVEGNQVSCLKLFDSILKHETLTKNGLFCCDDTPKNMFYLDQIFKLSPIVKVLWIVRDPRAILASQKKKWTIFIKSKRFIRAFEVLSTYNPIFHSILWDKFYLEGEKFKKNDALLKVYYQKLVNNFSDEINKIYAFIGIKVTQKNKFPNILVSSHGYFRENNDPSELIDLWDKKKQLSNAEIYICEKINKSGMIRENFYLKNKKLNIRDLAEILLWGLFLPVNLFFMLIIYFGRTKNIFVASKRRFFGGCSSC